MLYTGKGDKGDTYFFDSGDRVSKSSHRAEALGDLDELNSFMGLCRAAVGKSGIGVAGTDISDIAENIQQKLFVVQAAVAGAEKEITSEDIKNIEDIIADIEKELPPISTFFLPGATELSALFDVTRTVARRAERTIVRFSENGGTVNRNTLAYLNRLSSLLYALARIVNLKTDTKETPPHY